MTLTPFWEEVIVDVFVGFYYFINIAVIIYGVKMVLFVRKMHLEIREITKKIEKNRFFKDETLDEYAKRVGLS